MSHDPNAPPPGAPTPAPPRSLSPNLQKISDAIRAQPQPPRALFAGFDLYLEIIASGHLTMRDFVTGGVPARGDEPENTVRVPLQVLGGRIVLSLDPTIAPDDFYLKA